MSNSKKNTTHKKRRNTQRKRKGFNVKKLFGETTRDKQIARIKVEEMNFPLRDKKITPSEKIFKLTGEQFDNMLIRTNTPVLARLFSKENMEKFNKLSKEQKSYTLYHKLLNKE